MAKDPEISFKNFLKKQEPVDKPLVEYVAPAHALNDEPMSDVDNDIPALYATIHFKSEHRPNGHTAADMVRMNNAANAHLPHLQQDVPEDDE